MIDQDFAATVSLALAAADRCTAAETSDNYAVLGDRLEQLETLAKETVHARLAYRPIVDKLREGTALTPDELKTLRALIVGDAEYYVKYDEEFDRSKGELTKIIAEIRQLQSNEPDVSTLMHVAVLCREAMTLLAATEHYLEQKERVRRFEQATQGAIDPEAGRTLARIIEGMAAA